MNTPPDSTIPDELRLAFAPIHKRAFGLAIGLAAGIAAFLATTVAIFRPELAEYGPSVAQLFPGYTVSFQGALVALAWAMFSGFVFGWFGAFCRNLAFASSIWLARSRAELAATRDFLDHV